MVKLSKLNQQGEQEFRKTLNDLSKSRNNSPSNSEEAIKKRVVELAKNPAMTEGYGAEIDVIPSLPRDWSRLKLAKYLYELFPEAKSEEVLKPEADAMWTWLACLWFEQLFNSRACEPARFIVDRRPLKIYRHLVRGPYETYLILRRHFRDPGEEEKADAIAEFFLGEKLNQIEDVYEQCASRSWLMSRKELVKLVYMYYGETNQRRAANRKDTREDDPTGTSLRRFLKELDRLQLIYYVPMMRTEDLKEHLQRFQKLRDSGAGMPSGTQGGMAAKERGGSG